MNERAQFTIQPNLDDLFESYKQAHTFIGVAFVLSMRMEDWEESKGFPTLRGSARIIWVIKTVKFLISRQIS